MHDAEVQMRDAEAQMPDVATVPSRLIGACLRAVLPRPSLWLTALRVVLRLAAPGWWRRWPPLPVPPVGYWRFRLVTAYGGDGDPNLVSPADVVSYLRWCRSEGGRTG